MLGEPRLFTTTFGHRLRGMAAMIECNRRELLVIALAVVASAALEFPSILSPRLYFDDFVILRASWDGPATMHNLWVPHNEHAMPLGRLLAWAVVQLGSADSLSPRCALQGPLAAGLAAGLVWLWVRREFGQPLPALLAAALYGVTLKYQEVVYWYAASFWLLGFDTILLALLAAQGWRRTGQPVWLALAVLGCALAPGWYAGGIIAGPLCTLYLLPQAAGGRPAWRGRALALAPMLGTALFLAVSLPQNAGQIMHARHYGQGTALDAFDPVFGLACAGRAVVDILFFNPTGERGVACPRLLVPFVLAAVAAVAAWWAWRSPRRTVLLELGLIVGHYTLTFSPRSAWPYDQMLHWSRYQLVPWFGMVLLMAGGLASRLAPAGELGRRSSWVLVLLIATLFIVQGSAAWVYWAPERARNHQQRDVLRRVARTDRCCREYRISGADAKAGLEPLEMPQSGGMSAWELLRGSDRPQPHTPEEVRRLCVEGAE